MSNISPINTTQPLQLYGCNCATCRSLHGARASLAAIPIHQMNTTRVEADAANLVLEAERLIGGAQGILLQHHYQGQGYQKAIDEHPKGASPPTHAVDGALQVAIRKDSPAKSDSTVHPSQTASSWRAGSKSGSKSPQKSDEMKDYEENIRSRLAELGLLRDQARNTQIVSPTVANQEDGSNVIMKKSKFLVCDHCR